MTLFSTSAVPSGIRLSDTNIHTGNEERVVKGLEKYKSIIDHPHHVSSTHPQMPMINRAAQFSPFAALTGYDDQIAETSRLTDRRIELTEAEEDAISKALGKLERGDVVELTYFVPDKRKAGGRYVTEKVTVKQVVAADGKIKLADGRGIEMESIIEVGELDIPDHCSHRS